MSLTHFDAQGQAHMVDVSGKADTAREAVAEGLVLMAPETLALAQGGAAKGDVLGVARLAGIMGAKRTSELIPLCHPLPIAKVSVDLVPDTALPGVRVTATVRTTGKTGVEMEALTAATVGDLAPLTQLLVAVGSPFEERPGLERYAEPAEKEFSASFRTFCGT